MRRLITTSFVLSLVVVFACDGTTARLTVEDGPERVAAFLDGGDGGGRGGDSGSDGPGADATDGGRRPPVGDSGGGGSQTDAAGDDATQTRDTSNLTAACADVPRTLDFGSRIVGSTHEQTFRVTNCGGFEAQNLEIASMRFVNDGGVVSSPEFAFANLQRFPLGVAPNDSEPFQVRFRPVGPGVHSAVIRLETNDPDNASVDIAVSAVAE